MKPQILLPAVAFFCALSGAAQASSITLAWDPSPSSGVAGYTVFYGTQAGSYTVSVDVGPATTWTTTLLADDRPYYFAVQAYTSNGLVSPLSSSVSGTPTVTIVGPSRDDIGGDGHADLVWQHATEGWLSIWHMNGNLRIGDAGTNPARVPTVWRLAGMGDLNGDGHLDIIWQHRTEGWLSVWFMNGGTKLGDAVLSRPRVLDPNWKIVAVADMNGDGKDDLIWQHDVDGTLAVWYMNGYTVLADAVVSPSRVADRNWRVIGAGDANRDGKPDLFWHHKTEGWVAVWLMDGRTKVGELALSPNRVSDLDWEPQAVVDLNGDGYPDLVWHHRTRGSLAVWALRGGAAFEQTTIVPGTVNDVNWSVVGPK